MDPGEDSFHFDLSINQPIEERPGMRADDIKYNLKEDEFPPLPKNILLCSTVLLIIGSVLIIVGFIEEVVDVDPTKGIAFWVLGGLVFIPGVYYVALLVKAFRA